MPDSPRLAPTPEDASPPTSGVDARLDDRHRQVNRGEKMVAE